MMAVTTEQAALFAALWGDPETVLDAVDAGHLNPARWSPQHRELVAAIGAVIRSGRLPDPDRVVLELATGGMPQIEAVAVVILEGTFEALGCRVGTFAEHYRRAELERKLARLADTLYRPGGADRVEQILGEMAA